MVDPRSEAQRRLDDREAALKRIAAEQYGWMYRVAQRILRNPEAAEEAVHNAWVNLCHSDRVLEVREERAYVAQAVRREAFALWRRDRRYPAADEGAEMLVADRRPTPEQSAAATMMLRRVEALPAKERAVVVLWYREGLSLVEIAELFGLPESTVRRRFMRAKASLRAMLGARQPAGREVAAGERSSR